MREHEIRGPHPAHSVWDEGPAIAEALAALPAPVGMGFCVLCHGWIGREDQNLEDHKRDCPWRWAREAMDATK